MGCHLISISIGVGYVRGGFVTISRTSNIVRVNFTGKGKKWRLPINTFIEFLGGL